MPHFETHFREDHPAASGHFPGNPIIPGALLIDTAFHAIVGQCTTAEPYTIRSAKFHRIVRPGDRIRIEWEHRRGDTHFRCVVINTGEVAVTGIICGAPP